MKFIIPIALILVALGSWGSMLPAGSHLADVTLTDVLALAGIVGAAVINWLHGSPLPSRNGTADPKIGGTL